MVLDSIVLVLGVAPKKMFSNKTLADSRHSVGAVSLAGALLDAVSMPVVGGFGSNLVLVGMIMAMVGTIVIAMRTNLTAVAWNMMAHKAHPGGEITHCTNSYNDVSGIFKTKFCIP